jgi:hypothetical protein
MSIQDETQLKEMFLAIQKEMRGKSPTECMKMIKSILASNDIVVGVWPAPEEPSGISYHVIKGANLLREVIASGKAATAAMGVAPCVCVEQAVAAENIFGDKTH